MPLVVTGASGWIARETVDAWLRYSGSTSVIGLSTTLTTVQTARGVSIRCIDWSRGGASVPTTGGMLVHCAYVTREHLVNDAEFTRKNLEIRNHVERILAITKPDCMVYLSSGAVTRPGDIYGELKLADEGFFAEACTTLGIPLVIARAYSLSGANCNRPKSFLFYDLMRQAIFENSVRIWARQPVWRRYVDASEYMGACMYAAQSGFSGVIESGGFLVEARELADQILNALRVQKRVIQEEYVDSSDVYASNASDMADWMSRSGISISHLDRQVLESRQAIRFP